MQDQILTHQPIAARQPFPPDPSKISSHQLTGYKISNIHL
jgi:hypothetical protein